MRRTLTIVLLLCMSFLANAQNELSEVQIKQKLDSILHEGNLLYNYEKAAWLATDFAMEKEELDELVVVGYHVYKDGDLFKVIFYDEQMKCIYECSFIGGQTTINTESVEARDLTDGEKKAIEAKDKIITQIMEGDYNVNNVQGFSLNLILISYDAGYKFYIITGTSKSNIIPFGNDYIFWADKNGTITQWRKFHSVLIPLETQDPDGNPVVEMIHSHLKTEPFITATDICTFKLYGELYGLDKFSVLSTALSKRFTYSISTNKIEVEDSASK